MDCLCYVDLQSSIEHPLNAVDIDRSGRLMRHGDVQHLILPGRISLASLSVSYCRSVRCLASTYGFP